MKEKITYHDPCHLVRGQEVEQQPRQLLKLIPGIELVEMEESNRCCGGAGIYSIIHEDLSMSILDKKMANIAATGANVIVTGCPGCQIQLGLGVKLKGLDARILHPVQLLDRAYRTAEQ